MRTGAPVLISFLLASPAFALTNGPAGDASVSWTTARPWVAKKARKAKPKSKGKPAPPMTPAAPAAPAAPAVDPYATLNPAELLAAARLKLADLEYEEVARLAGRLLERPDLTDEQRGETCWLQANALAVMGDMLGAEKSLRLLLQLQPDFSLPPDTTPKVVAVLSKVQLEERAIREQRQQALRATLVATLALEGGPGRAVGGAPLAFDFTVTDPQGAARAVRIHFRRPGDPGFSSLALSAAPDGAWTGAIPGEALVNDGGMTLNYYVQVLDAAGEPLLERGAAAAPLSLEVAPGRIVAATPFYRSVWFWSAVAGVTAAATGTGLYLYNRQQAALPESDLGEFRLRR